MKVRLFAAAALVAIALFAVGCVPPTGPPTTTVPVDCSAPPAPGVNWSGCDIGRFANLAGANLAGANLSGAVLSYADLSGANLSGADLSFAYLDFANLTGADLSYADLSAAFMWYANMTDADLTGAIWRNTLCPNDVVQSVECPRINEYYP